MSLGLRDLQQILDKFTNGNKGTAISDCFIYMETDNGQLAEVGKIELQESIKLMNEEGFTGHVDFLIDSLEYEEFFGEDIVPFPRFWNSPCGSTTSSFINTAKFRKGYATSDNVIY